MPRIIAGIARGRKLAVPPAGTRPTADRAKEGLFSSLDARYGFQDITCLDLFSGSGAFGMEAASRGAAQVVLVEREPGAIKTIKKNIASTGLSQVQLVETSVAAYLAACPTEHFEMVLADPPYDLPDAEVAELLAALRPALRDQAIVVVERHRDSPETAWPEGFVPTTQKLKKRIFGIARMDMAIYHAEVAAAS